MTSDQDRARALVDEWDKNIRPNCSHGDLKALTSYIAAAFAEVREACAVKLEAMAHENEIGQYILREAAAAIREGRK